MNRAISLPQVREESRIPLLIFMAIILATLAINSLFIEDPYARARAIQQWPEVYVSTRNLVDECGVYMWVRWSGPDFAEEGPYIPMKFRYDY